MINIIFFGSFVIGIILGSYLAALVNDVVNKNQKRTRKSICDKCKKNLSFFENIPCLGYFLVKGKCLGCEKNISFFYPVVEFLTGLIAMALVYIALNSYINPLFITFYVFLFWFISLIDYKEGEFDVNLVITLVLVALSVSLLNNFSFQETVLSALIGSGFFGFQYLISKGEWMGEGDIIVGLSMGLVLGVSGIITSIMLSYIFASIVVIILLGMKVVSRKSKIPLVPFLFLGTMVSLFLDLVVGFNLFG